MTIGTATQAAPRFGRMIGGTLFGSILVAAGLVTAYLTIATPLVSGLVSSSSASGPFGVGFGVWSFALIAGGAFLVAGTNRLALILASLKAGGNTRGPAARALASSPDAVTVASVVVPGDARPVPELVIGPFGAAIVHSLAGSKQVRHGVAGWESLTRDGWGPMDDPLVAVMHDSERVRHWLGSTDLDFVVRVYGALIVDKRDVQRSPTCAVLMADQIPGWIESLPRQRTLTAGRRARLVTMATSPRNVRVDARH